MYHLARARTSETWTTIAASRIPTLLLLATRPEEARRANDRAATRFSASIPHAEVQFVDDATHSLITDAREGFGTLVVEWLDSLP